MPEHFNLSMDAFCFYLLWLEQQLLSQFYFSEKQNKQTTKKPLRHSIYWNPGGGANFRYA